MHDISGFPRAWHRDLYISVVLEAVLSGPLDPWWGLPGAKWPQWRGRTESDPLWPDEGKTSGLSPRPGAGPGKGAPHEVSGDRGPHNPEKVERATTLWGQHLQE